MFESCRAHQQINYLACLHFALFWATAPETPRFVGPRDASAISKLPRRVRSGQSFVRSIVASAALSQEKAEQRDALLSSNGPSTIDYPLEVSALPIARESGLFTMRFSSSSCRSREGGPNRLVDVAKNDLVYRETSRACLDSFSFSAGDQLRIRPTLVCCWGWNERCRDPVPQAWPPRRYYARVATSWNREQTAALKGTDTAVRGRSDPC